MPPSNNHVERAIRPAALSRKNWLFAGAKSVQSMPRLHIRLSNVVSYTGTTRA
ncbi:MAG: transposase, partial [Bdellovibrionales bacterium]|nr:transposase [Bdellovibrionales bacterium]